MREVLVFVTGGRDYSGEPLIYSTLDAVRAMVHPARLVVVHTGGPGAPALCGQYARVTHNAREALVESAFDVWPVSLAIAFPGADTITVDRLKRKGVCVFSPI